MSSISYDEYERGEYKCRLEKETNETKNRYYKMLYFEIQQNRLERTRLLEMKSF